MAFAYFLRFFRGLHAINDRCFRGFQTAKTTSVHTSALAYSLLELKQSSRLDVKKDCGKDVIQAIHWRKKHGIHGGSLALDQIQVIDTIARLPDEIYNPRDHMDYIVGYKQFFEELFGGKEQLQDSYYLNLQSYVLNRMTTVEDMLLFIYHPYYQAEEEFLEFIPAAFHMLENLHGEDFPIPPPRGTVDPVLKKGKFVWHVAYKVICAEEKVDILESINRLPKHYRLGFMSLYFEGKDGTPYDNTGPRDELIFFKNICEHISEHMKISSRTDLYEALYQAFPNVPIKMFRFLWTYKGYHHNIWT